MSMDDDDDHGPRPSFLRRDTNLITFGPKTPIEQVFSNPAGLEAFTKFLELEFSSENIDFWHEVNELLLESALPQQQHEKARDIAASYVGLKSTNQVNISHALAEGVQAACEVPWTTDEELQGCLTSCLKLFVKCQEEIVKLLAQDSYRRFIGSQLWNDFISNYNNRELIRFFVAKVNKLHKNTPRTIELDKHSRLLTFFKRAGSDDHEFQLMADQLTPRHLVSASLGGRTNRLMKLVFFTALDKYPPEKKEWRLIFTDPSEAATMYEQINAVMLDKSQYLYKRKKIVRDPNKKGVYAERLELLQQQPEIDLSMFDYQSIIHSSAMVGHQLEASVETTSRLASYLSKISAAKQRYAKSIISEEARQARRSTAQAEDRMLGFFSRSSHSLQSTLVGMAEQDRIFSDRIEDEVIPSIVTIANVTDSMRKDITKAQMRCSSTYKGVQDKLKKRRKDCIKALDALFQEEIRAKKRMFSSSGGISRLLHNSTGARAKFITMAEKYLEAIEQTNTAQSTFFATEMPEIFQQFQKVEVKRLKQLAKILARLGDITQELVEPNTGTSLALKAVVDQLSPGHDLLDFIEHRLSHWGAAQLPPSNVYDLPVLPQELWSLDNISALIESGETGLFGVSLPAVLEAQKILHPELSIPLLLSVLMTAFRRLEGTTTASVFATDPPFRDSYRLRRKLEATVEHDAGMVAAWANNNVHTVAALIKQWLIALPDPVIPGSLYVRCLALGKDDRINADKVQAVLAKMPAPHKATFVALGGILSEIAHNYKQTGMTGDRLADVLAPYIIRAPESDQLERLTNLKYETRFVRHALTPKVVTNLKFMVSQNKPRLSLIHI